MGGRRAIIATGVSLLFLGAVAVPSLATFGGTDGRISFTRFLPPSESLQIFSAAPDGSDIQRLTDPTGQGRSAALSDWAPDGNTIAIDSNRVDVDGRKNVVQVYVMDSDGSNVEQITRGKGFHGAPGYSPDGQTLAIDADWGIGDLAGIWTVPTDDPNGVTVDEADRVTDVPGDADFDSEPQISPDGTSIVFTRFRAPDRSATFTVDVDGDNEERLTSFKLNTSDPDWAPDGSMIAFDSGDSGFPGAKGDVWVMNADGTEKEALTDTRPVGQNGEITAAQNPVWAPSGTRIMFTRFLPHGSSKLLEIDPDGSNKETVINDGKFSNKVDWGVHP